MSILSCDNICDRKRGTLQCLAIKTHSINYQVKQLHFANHIQSSTSNSSTWFNIKLLNSATWAVLIQGYDATSFHV